MAQKPSYRSARNSRKTAAKEGSGSMEIESKDPSNKIIDLSKSEPHTETLAPPKKPGQVELPGMSAPGSPDTLHADPGVVHGGDYGRPAFTGVVKT